MRRTAVLPKMMFAALALAPFVGACGDKDAPDSPDTADTASSTDTAAGLSPNHVAVPAAQFKAKVNARFHPMGRE